MPITITPYIPTYITVHLGPPDSNAEDVTVPFVDYIKNVACSEIYPTWQEAALRANIMAQVSFALNRIYTEYYPSRGYNFNITASTSIDQKYIRGRTIFQNVSNIVDDLFRTYIRRQGYAEPLFAQFCNGTTTTCDGLSQWGSEELASQGYQPFPILQHYYGYDIELVTNAPVQEIQYSFPGYPLRLGSVGPEVGVLQTMINQVATAYPQVPTLWPVDGVFGEKTEEAVRIFQSIFDLTADGIVGKNTWYQLVSLYVGLRKLSDLASLGQQYYGTDFFNDQNIKVGDEGDSVYLLQYVLSVLSQFDPAIPFVDIDGIFGINTYQAVVAFQKQNGLRQNGIVNPETWSQMLEQYNGISHTILNNPNLVPVERISAGTITPEELENVVITENMEYPGTPISLGGQDSEGEA